MALRAGMGPSTLVRWLGYAGLIPFIALAVGIWLTQAPLRSHLGAALAAYGASILSFLGAIHWGLAMREADHNATGWTYLWGVSPSLLAWVAMLLPVGAGLVLLVCGLWACFGVDRIAYPRFGVQAWLPVRLQLTSVASVACLAGAWGIAL